MSPKGTSDNEKKCLLTCVVIPEQLESIFPSNISIHGIRVSASR